MPPFKGLFTKFRSFYRDPTKKIPSPKGFCHDSHLNDPSRIPQMNLQSYWDEIYSSRRKKESKEPFFDWFAQYEKSPQGSFNKLIQQTLNQISQNQTNTCRILDLGCGTSSLTFRLFTQGYSHVTGIDFSAEAVSSLYSTAIQNGLNCQLYLNPFILPIEAPSSTPLSTHSPSS
eukprot:Sdes_comp18905_c0_seq1m9354